MGGGEEDDRHCEGVARSNPVEEGPRPGLLRPARNDGRIKSVKIRVNPRTKFLSC
ncbi:MAG: hypothetical protein LBT00_02230 [Spirochaetaceae bacterium]|nr:hypothetical protein [Spirochaetaceae bacterium]